MSEKKNKVVSIDPSGKDIISFMEDYFGCGATPIDEFESIEATETVEFQIKRSSR